MAKFWFRSPGNAYVEGDASSASYFLAGAAITGETVTVEGCGKPAGRFSLLLIIKEDTKFIMKID